MNDKSVLLESCVECNNNLIAIPKYKLCKQCYDRMRRGKHSIKISEYFKTWYKEKGKYQRKKRIIPMVCAKCGFEAQVAGQIEKHHINGNHHDNNPDNITYICANCHRFISYTDKHYGHKNYDHLHGLNKGRLRF